MQYDKLVRAIDSQGDSAHNVQVIHSLRNANAALKRQLEDIRASRSNKEHFAEAEFLGPTNSKIRAELGWLEDRLTKTCSAFGYSSSVIQPLSEESVRLRWLIERVSGKSIQQFNTYISSTRISDHQLARALAAAIVCELAFESPFPDSLGSESLLLHGYREQVSLQGQSTSHARSDHHRDLSIVRRYFRSQGPRSVSSQINHLRSVFPRAAYSREIPGPSPRDLPASKSVEPAGK